MTLIEIFLIGIALSMDAFAVSISDGLVIRHVTFRKAFTIAFTFGAFQFAMPVIGYVGASFFYRWISAIDHWLAFGLLAFLGIRMIIEATKEIRAKRSGQNSSDEKNDSGVPMEHDRRGKKEFLSFKELVVQGIATSIDALAVGISFAATATMRSTYAETLLASAINPALVIGLTTTILCLPAVFIGKKTGDLLSDKAQILGGLLLIGIGAKILIEHLFFGG